MNTIMVKMQNPEQMQDIKSTGVNILYFFQKDVILLVLYGS